MLGSGAADPANPFGQFTVGIAIAFFLAMLLSAVIYGALIALIDGVAKSQPLSMSQAFAVGLQRFFPLAICGLLYSLAVVLGMIALIIPGIILSITLLFGVYAVVTDNLGPIAALKYSHNLVWGNWWRTAAVVFVATFILIVGMMLVGALSGVALAMGGTVEPDSFQTSAIFNFIVVPLISALLAPLFYTFAMAAYNDLKLRRDGADLAARIGTQA